MTITRKTKYTKYAKKKSQTSQSSSSSNDEIDDANEVNDVNDVSVKKTKINKLRDHDRDDNNRNKRKILYSDVINSPVSEEEMKIISLKGKTIDDLILIGNTFKKHIFKLPDELGLTMKKYESLVKISSINKELVNINNMIGLKDAKEAFVGQLIYLLSEYKKYDDFMNIIISGPPGHGKTE